MPHAERLDAGDPDLELWRVDTGPLQLVFLPSVGGRLLSLRADGREHLWVNPRVFDDALRAVRPRASWPVVDGTFASWTNVGGGKSWPAPQGWGGAGEWAGPPDPVLDSGGYSFDAVERDGALTVRMTSAPDPRTGLLITRAFTMRDGARTFDETIRFENVTDEPVRWSLWEVAQVPSHDLVGSGRGVEVRGARGATDLGAWAGAIAARSEPGRVVVPIEPGVAKFGFPDAGGSIALRDAHGAGLELRFAVEPGAEYPDAGSRAEVWTQSPLDAPIAELSGLHPDAWLVELEVLSPLRTIAPGDDASFSIEWVVGPTD